MNYISTETRAISRLDCRTDVPRIQARAGLDSAGRDLAALRWRLHPLTGGLSKNHP